MNQDDFLTTLEQLTPEQFGYLGLAATFGPLALRLFGFKLLSRLVRPLALLAIVGGLYAKQQLSEGQGGS